MVALRRKMPRCRPQLEALEFRVIPATNPVEGHLWDELVYGFNVHREAQESELEATVDWGDGEGATKERVRKADGDGAQNWEVWGDKTFRHWGSYELSITLHDKVTNALFIANRPMLVEMAKLRYASKAFQATEGMPYYGPIAQIEYDHPLATKDDLVAQVGGWGDERPSPEAGEVRQVGTGVFEIWGRHTYRNVPDNVTSANYTVTAQAMYVDATGGPPQRGVQGNSLAVVANVVQQKPSPSMPNVTVPPVATPGDCLGGVSWHKFVANYRQAFGRPTAAQQAGLRELLSALGQDTRMTDERWKAYVLATIKHETAGTFRPIKEIGGQRQRYGQPTRGPDGRLHRYYGRGYVQLTFKSNYLKLGRVLWTRPEYADLRRDGLIRGPNDLANNPDLLYNPRISYAVASYGMRTGSFRSYVVGHRYVRVHGKLVRRPVYAPATLGTFFNTRRTDYYNAREIINADKHLRPKWAKGARIGDLIGGYARKFAIVLRTSKCAPTSSTGAA